MALIKCNDCGKDVSPNADSCPNCGNNIQKQIEIEKAKIQEEQRKAKEIQEQEKQKRIEEWREKGELCPYCQSHSSEDVCANCKKSKTEYEKEQRKNEFSSLIGFIIFIVIIILGIAFTQSEPDKTTSSSHTKGGSSSDAEVTQWRECSNRSNTYQKCDWSFSEDKCVCKLR